MKEIDDKNLLQSYDFTRYRMPIEVRKTNNSIDLSFGLSGDLNNPLFRAGSVTIAGSVIGSVIDYIFNKKVENGIVYGGIGGFILWGISELINSGSSK